MPDKPYCSNDLSSGLIVRPKDQALKHKYIQHNPPKQVQAIVIDIDHDQSFNAADENNVQLPSLMVLNPENGHGHAVYLLKNMVTVSAAARMKPQRWLAGLERAYTRRLSGDMGYTGLISRNPLLHPILDSSRIYDMSELDAPLDFTDKAPYRESHLEHGTGRNCTMFDLVRVWAYKKVLFYVSETEFYNDVLKKCREINGGFNHPLSDSEPRATAKSITKWTWRNRFNFGHEKNRGVLMLDMCEEMGTKQKQREGALYTAKIKRETSSTKIQAAYELLKSSGKKATQANVAEVTKLSLRTVKNHWKEITK
jgi:hypothetical protein